MKYLVYPTDFSENSVAALRYAYTISKKLKVKVIILHVFDPDDLEGGLAESEKKDVWDHHKRRLENFCSLNLKQDFEDLGITVALVKGRNVSKEIVEYIKDKNVQVLVMGACGSGTIKDFFLGSTSTKMLSISPVPVLTVPANYEYRNIEKVLYSTDFEKDDITNIRKLVRFLHPLQAHLTILHVASEKEITDKNYFESFRSKLMDTVQYRNMDYKIDFSDDILNTMKTAVDEVGTDMLVMLERGPELTHRDLVKKMQASITVPLLSFRKAG